MDEEIVYAVERACIRVLTQYFFHVDRHDFEAAVAYLLPDVIRNVDGDCLLGRDGVLATMQAFIDDLSMRHMICNVMATVIDADHASLTYNLAVYCHKDVDVADGTAAIVGIDHICDQVDKFVKMEEGWRIAQRDITTVLQDTTAVPTPAVD